MSRGSHSGSERGPIQCSTSCVGEPRIIGLDDGAGVPGDLRREREQVGEGHRVADRVGRAVPGLAPPLHDELGQVVDVDHLCGETVERRGEHVLVAGEREPRHPVSEAVGRIAGADDQARPDDRGTIAEGGADGRLGRRLRPRVVVLVARLGRLAQRGGSHRRRSRHCAA